MGKTQQLKILNLKKAPKILLLYFPQITTIRRIRPHAVYLW